MIRYLVHYAILVVLMVAASAAFADPMVPSGGATVNVPPAAVDWFARISGLVTGGLAIAISATTLVWTRIDKSRERKAAADAKLPQVDLHVGKGDVAVDWSFQVSTKNRAEVSIEFVSIEVGADFQLRSEDAASREWYPKLMIDLDKISPGDTQFVEGDIHGRYVGRQAINFSLAYRIFEPTPRMVKIEIRLL
jgi:hypothetical protein